MKKRQTNESFTDDGLKLNGIKYLHLETRLSFALKKLWLRVWSNTYVLYHLSISKYNLVSLYSQALYQEDRWPAIC